MSTTSDTPLRTRGDFLRLAAALTEGDRNATHGDPIEQNGLAGLMFQLWRSRAERNEAMISNMPALERAALVQAAAMCFIKLSRIACGSQHNPDNYVDLAAYAGIMGEAAQRGGAR